MKNSNYLFLDTFRNLTFARIHCRRQINLFIYNFLLRKYYLLTAKEFVFLSSHLHCVFVHLFIECYFLLFTKE